MRKILLAFALGAFSSPVFSDPSLECSVTKSSQIEIGDCVALAEKSSHAAVDAAFSFAMQAAKELDEVTGRKISVPALTASQTSWQNYRTQHCDFVGATYGGGSGTGIAITSCRVTLDRARVEDLMKFTN